MVECDLFKEIRRRLIPKYFWARPSMNKVIELVTTERSSLLKRLSKCVCFATKIQQNVGRPWIKVMLLDTLLIRFHSQARCPELCVFLLWNVLSSPGGRYWNRCPGTQSCFYAHKMIDDVHWGGLGTPGWNLPMPDLLMSVSTTYPWATRQRSQQPAPGHAQSFQLAMLRKSSVLLTICENYTGMFSMSVAANWSLWLCTICVHFACMGPWPEMQV